MDKKEAALRIEKLKNLINRYRYAYHVLDKSEISDAAFDTLKNELEELERQFPDLITPDSPTQRVGGEPLEKFEKVEHKIPMLSLNDAFGEKEIFEWEERIQKLIPDEKIDYFCELKLDGLAVSLVYKNGIFVQGSTRGDGKIGEDVTQNLKTIESIPLRLRLPEDEELRSAGFSGDKIKKIKESVVKGEIEVRGEVLMLKKIFEELNKKLRNEGKPILANTRNAAAGSIRQLDPKITASRHLDCYIYSLVTDLGQVRHQQEHKLAKFLGFKTIKQNKFCPNLKEVINFHHYWEKHRNSLPFGCDGVVVVVDKIILQKKLGEVGKAPRWMEAYKFSPEEATTIVRDIKIQVGRTGVLTPVAVLEPVEIGGVVITRATLHNKEEIKRLGIKIGDTVIVGRAGDVIPDIRKVLKELRTGKERSFKIPSKCPVCGSKVVEDKGGIILRCPNKKCPSRQKRLLSYFVSKPAFDIEGLGPKVIEQLVEEGLIQDPADIFELREGDLIPLERFAEKSAANLVKAINSKRRISLPRFLVALGIPQVGEETAQVLARRFGSLKRIQQAKLDDFLSIYDIGPVVASNIYHWFQNKHNKEYLTRLLKHIVIEPFKQRESKIAGLRFVLTGSLKNFSRQEAKEKLRSLGAEVAESVSSKVDYLVVGEEPGSKLEKAKKLGIKIIDEKEFLKLIS